MSEMQGLLTALKESSIQAFEETKPCGIFFGTVVSDKPLAIKIEQKITLTEKQLVLCREVTEYETKVTIGASLVTDGTFKGETLDPTYSGGSNSEGCDHVPSAVPFHHHQLKFAKHIETKIVVHNTLKTGEKVVLIRKQGGQKFVVVDRVGEA